MILGEGLWTRLYCEAVAHVFVVDLRCGRYAAALGLFPPAVSPLIRSGLCLDSVSGGRGRAAAPNLVSLQAHCLFTPGRHLRSLVRRATEILTFFLFEPFYASIRPMHHHDRNGKDLRRVVKT